MISLPQPHTTQPPGAVVLDRNWARRIAFASITGLNGGRELTSGLFPTVQGTVSSRASEKGRASYTGSVASGLVWSSLTPIPSIFNTGMAFLIFANPAAQATQQRALFLGDETSAGGSFNQASLAFNCDKTGTGSSGLFSCFEYSFGFAATTQSTAGAVDGNWHVFIGNKPANFGYWDLYRDGITVSSTATPANGIVLNAGARVHVNPGSTVGYTGNAVLAVFFNRFLNANEIIELSANPWCVFEPENYWIWPVAGTPPSAGPLPVFVHHYRNQGIM
jgi:hypothetical protein